MKDKFGRHDASCISYSHGSVLSSVLTYGRGFPIGFIPAEFNQEGLNNLATKVNEVISWINPTASHLGISSMFSSVVSSMASVSSVR